MKKHVCLLVALIAMVAFVVPARAQMSDDAVISHVESALSSGKSQDQIIKDLALKGVTKEQAERIKRKMEESKQVKIDKPQDVTKRDHAVQVSEELNEKATDVESPSANA